jgi:hypothetical protein
LALKVCENMLCCINLTSWPPFKNMSLASVEAAVCSSQMDEYCPL